MRSRNKSPLGQRDLLVWGAAEVATGLGGAEPRGGGLQGSGPKAEEAEADPTPFGFPDGSSEKSAEEDATQSPRGVVSAQL